VNVFTGNRARINGCITVSIRVTDVDRLIQEYDICTMIQLKWLKVMLWPSSMMLQGPSSKSNPVEELHPGPPLSHRRRGAYFGATRDSKNLE